MRQRVVLFVAIVIVVLAATAMTYPARLVEMVSGASCTQDNFCTDDLARLTEARQLYDEAVAFIATSISPLEKRPLVVFCATENCYRSFGFSNATAKSVGGFCIVISPRGWKPYYVRHEMIHRLQAQQLGTIRMYSEPEWFIEGMAYSLSQDPRPELAEPFQSFRSKFQSWYQGVGKGQIWVEAKRL
jgi:hypothetical protein